MTLDDVHAAALALAAEGVQPSGNALVRYCHERGQRLSKRTALKHLQALTAAGEVFAVCQPVPTDAPVPTPAPVPAALADDAPASHAAPPDPVDLVAQAEAAVLACEIDLDVARENMDMGVLTLWISRGLIIEGVRFGGYAEGDPARLAVQEAAKSCMAHYRETWREVEAARTHLTLVQRQYQRGHQERWVQQHRPEVVATLHFWQEELRVATSDRAHAHAKKELSVAMQGYEAAVATAPWNGTNGTH